MNLFYDYPSVITISKETREILQPVKKEDVFKPVPQTSLNALIRLIPQMRKQVTKEHIT